MSYRSTVRSGLGLAPGYQIMGYCPGTNLPNWVRSPDGSLSCMTNDQIFGGPANAVVPSSGPVGGAVAQTVGATSAVVSGSPASVATFGSSAGPVDFLSSTFSWIQANPWPSAGIAAGVLFLVAKR